MNDNPWAVDSLNAFTCPGLKCPECEFHTKKDTVFENHATENHPLSFVLFSKKEIVKQELLDGNLPNLANIKEEPRTEIDEFDQASRSSSQDQEQNLYEDPTRICEVSFDEKNARSIILYYCGACMFCKRFSSILMQTLNIHTTTLFS